MDGFDQSREKLAGLLGGLGAPRILVVGDLMLDLYSQGQVRRPAPEGDAEVLTEQKSLSFPGGAANVAMNAAGLGAQVALVGVTGADAEGEVLRQELRRGGVGSEGIVPVKPRPTTLKQRFSAGSWLVLRVDREDVSTLQDAVVDQLCARISDLGRDCHAFIVSDYAKGVVTDRVFAAVLACARETGGPVLVDPKGGDFTRYAGASYLTPNMAEMALAGLAVTDLGAMRSALDATGSIGLVVKRGAKGAKLVSATEDLDFAVPALDRAETIGAGDSFIAMLGLALAAGRSAAEAVRLANLAATHACSLPLTATVTLEGLQGGTHRAAREGWPAQIAAWRELGLRVGFTNGCFDVLHAGHVHLLEEARRHCDRLVVGLNTDESVRMLKGQGRPFHQLQDRQRLLRALRSVDLVVPFAEATPIGLIEAICPEVLVKGADYTVETVVGANIVQGYGGEVLLVDLVPGLSTTAVLSHAARREN